MKPIHIKKEAFGPAMAKAMETYAVAGPVPDREDAKRRHLFRCLEKGETPDLEYTATQLSPKALLFPQAETMFRFKVPSGGKKAPFL